MAINETIILLTPFKDYSTHRLSKYISYLRLSVPFDVCFYQPLQKIFSRVLLYDYLKRMVEVGVKSMNREVVQLVREEHPKFVLWVALGEYYEIQESTFDRIRKEGTKVVGWFLDDDVRFDYYSKWWAPYIDYFVTNDAEAVPKYQELGAWATTAICTGAPADRDWSKIEGKYDVSFVGSRRADRQQYLDEIEHKNLPFHLFGEGWGRFVSYEEMIDIFWASKINLNFSKTYEFMKLGIKARIFEVCLAGGFLLTEYFPGIEDYFEIDKEIVCFHNPEEMIDKVSYYLVHDEERRAIAQAGWKRATNEYTSFHMLSRVFQEIEEASTIGQKSNPKQLKMPGQIRRRISQYYYNLGEAFLLENYKGLWRETYALSIRYNPMKIRAWYHYILGFLPFAVRSSLIRLYRVLRYRKTKRIHKEPEVNNR
ncbi:glycosyltransferase [Chloroflexota bacterium]